MSHARLASTTIPITASVKPATNAAPLPDINDSIDNMTTANQIIRFKFFLQVQTHGISRIVEISVSMIRLGFV